MSWSEIIWLIADVGILGIAIYIIWEMWRDSNEH